MFWRRRFYKSPFKKVDAGKKECLIRHKGQINVRQLTIRYNANDTTGSLYCVLTIMIDGEQIINESFEDLYQYFCNGYASKDLAAPFVFRVYNSSAKDFAIMFLDLGTVKENIEVWFENVDTENYVFMRAAMIYDVYEEGK